MSKKTKTKPSETDKRIRALEKMIGDKKASKKERKAAKAEIEALKGIFLPFKATGITEAEPSSPSIAADGPTSSPVVSALAVGDAWREKQDAEVARQWAHHTAQLADPTGIAADLIIDETPPVNGHDPGAELEVVLEAPTQPDDGEMEEPDPVPSPQEARIVETDHGREIAVGPVEHVDGMPSGVDHPEVDPLAKPADPVLENGNGQPIITYIDPATGKEKTKGYTRVTTYIKGLEDTSILERWTRRILLEGGAVELLQHEGVSPSLEAVGRATKRLDDALADIDRREKIEGELLGLRRAELLKEHRDYMEKVAQDLLDLGGAHDKATKGTDIHRLTEIVDTGQPLPASTSASDRRDVEAYQAAIEKLGAEVLWTERRIVLDDIQVSGTMDRAYLVKLPGMARRVRVVGDVKTGSISWGQGKIAMQLALYARGLGYDWTEPTKRERLSLNQHHGLLVHLPQGEGRCEIFLVDLELAQKGLDLARHVREWRNTSKRAYDLKGPLVAVER